MRETAKLCRAYEGRVSDCDRPDSTAYHDNPSAYSLTSFLQPYSLRQSNVLFLFLSLLSQKRPTLDYACLSFPNSTRHSLSLTRQIIRIRALTLPIPSDADRPQWQSVGTRK